MSSRCISRLAAFPALELQLVLAGSLVGVVCASRSHLEVQVAQVLEESAHGAARAAPLLPEAEQPIQG